MRVAFAGASHWHLPLYLEPLRRLDGIDLVGMADPDPDWAAACRERHGCPGETDLGTLLARTRPDFVFALGQHADMARQAAILIEAGIPFALEKPCGLDAREVSGIARQAEARGSFAAVPLVLRNGGFLPHMNHRLADDPLHYASFRFVAGPPQRYRDTGCAWMLDPARAGGGALINLGVHFMDIARCWLPGAQTRVIASVMGNAAAGLPIEDYAAVTVSDGRRTVTVETGYLTPAATHQFDMHYAVDMAGGYVTVAGPGAVDIADRSGGRETLAMPTTNVPLYEVFVADVLDRARSGRPPLAGLDAMAEAFGLIDQAYAMAAPFRVARPA
ncbi:Gfo/Idh/MocA family protein [Prosthecodimorpha staleyi]|uniref:Gfo/Idh/MocA family oxidoreductase n=1 Tax=Prosthecodimorpha staleyi TaxID=2840188 RepID=A0A947D983_9HYPH|nr:Gfo/Idh/MocA family oxidoreductase [Prosthecodimorpha staleyi]MBT9290377.1 Gfo/Idh/MocA family oxidoreductase [Prosthecodimorpha staleyi]